jgi:hypothetical protein
MKYAERRTQKFASVKAGGGGRPSGELEMALRERMPRLDIENSLVYLSVSGGAGRDERWAVLGSNQ